MKPYDLTMTELNRFARGNPCDARAGQPARRGYFDRISQTIERVILAVVVLMTLVGNYATHSLLMSDVLIL